MNLYIIKSNLEGLRNLQNDLIAVRYIQEIIGYQILYKLNNDFLIKLNISLNSHLKLSHSSKRTFI